MSINATTTADNVPNVTAIPISERDNPSNMLYLRQPPCSKALVLASLHNLAICYPQLTKGRMFTHY